MTKRTMKLMSIVGIISLMLTGGVIGYTLCDCYVDLELLMQILLIYLPPIIGSVCITSVVMATKKPRVEVIELNNKEEV